MTDSPWLRWFFGIDVIPDGAQGLQLSWQYQPAAWGWLLIIIGSTMVASWSYRRVVGKTQVRVAMAAMRGLLLLLVAVLMAGPLLRLPIVENQPDWIAVLIDRSRSMGIVDDRTVGGSLRSRDDVAIEVAKNNVWREINEDREIVWLGFHASAFDVDPNALPPADGWSTELTVPIETALRRLAGRPASGIIIISDGRTARPIDRSVLRALQSRAIPVFVVPVGSSDAMSDMAIAETEAPSRAFIRDQVPVVATVRCAGGSPTKPIQVDLVEEVTGRVVDTTDIQPNEFVDDRAETVLTGARAQAGPVRWIVRVRGGQDDLVSANDEQIVEVDFIDRPLRILYIEGYPRWEFRYLKNMLVREPSFESSVMLLSADRDFAQEGNAPLERLPQSEEEFSKFDLFILGDVPSSSLSEMQIAQMKRAVSERGAGLLWIGGERSTPASWRGTELEDLLPMRGVPERFDESVFTEPTEGALRGGVMRLGETMKERWPIALTSAGDRGRIDWAQRIEIDSLKPTAEILARAAPRTGSPALPIVISMRYGAGLIVYVATDETWRWRHGVGETYQERFWIQFIRYLSRGAAQSDGGAFRLVVEPKQPEVGTPAMIRVEIQDPKAGDIAGDASLDVQVEPIEVAAGAAEQTVQLTRESTGWVGLWSADAPGTWRVRITSSRTGNMEQLVKVIRPDIELAYPESDHPQLVDLATRTVGVVVAPAEIARLSQLLPKRATSLERAILDPIWNSPAAFCAIMLLLFVEWVGRRWLRLA